MIMIYIFKMLRIIRRFQKCINYLNLKKKWLNALISAHDFDTPITRSKCHFQSGGPFFSKSTQTFIHENVLKLALTRSVDIINNIIP